MKTVFSNSQLAHVWAQLKQPHGRKREDSMHRINADGSIRVGCHTIYASQIEHLRSLLVPKPEAHPMQHADGSYIT